MGLQINSVKGIVDSIGDAIGSVDEIATSKEESKAQDNKLAELRNDLAEIQKEIINKTADLEIEYTRAKASVLQAELTGNKLQRNWRPIMMLCFGGIIVYQYFLVHFVNGIIGNLHGTFQMPVLNFPDNFWSLLELGIGGYIAGRSLEKIAPNVVKTIVDARETKRDLDMSTMKYENKQQRREIKQERREDRQERREERQERKEIKQDDRKDNRDEKQEERKNRRLQRRERGQKLIAQFFKEEIGRAHV